MNRAIPVCRMARGFMEEVNYEKELSTLAKSTEEYVAKYRENIIKRIDDFTCLTHEELIVLHRHLISYRQAKALNAKEKLTSSEPA
jgi:hypothetical protein